MNERKKRTGKNNFAVVENTTTSGASSSLWVTLKKQHTIWWNGPSPPWANLGGRHDLEKAPAVAHHSPLLWMTPPICILF